MRQILNVRKSIKIEEVPEPICGDGEVLVANVYSLISAGTERHSIEMRSKDMLSLGIELKKERPDLVKKVKDILKSQGILNTYRLVKEKLNEPVGLGYSSSGVVIDVGKNVRSLNIGDRVACGGGGYAMHAEIIRVPENLCVRVPDNVGLKQAAYTTVGAIALQGVRRASVQIGENVVVIGLGLIGLITAQILKASGCKVIGFDIDKGRVEMAKKLGIHGYVSREVDIFSVTSDFTRGVGADAVIITASTQSNGPVEDALRLIRKKGRIVVVGSVSMNIPREPFYEKEGDFLISTSYGPGRYDPNYEEKGIDYPIAYVRWTERRNMESFLDLLSSGSVDVNTITTHVFPIEKGEEAYSTIKEGQGIGVLIEYGKEKKEIKRYVEINAKRNADIDAVKVGIVGAGNFAKKVHLPNLKRIDGYCIYAIATSTPSNAKHIAKKYGMKYATTDYYKLCLDRQIDLIFISTRHGTHAKIAIEALKNGKHVFVEKPAALTKRELEEVLNVAKSSGRVFMVGLNRRFSPFVEKARMELRKKSGPIFVEYRVNAGKLPQNHWIYDETDGGGRIIGEGVHFFDTINYIINDRPLRIHVEHLRARNYKDIREEDNFIVTVRYHNGSVGTLTYTSIGNREYPKENIYIERDGMSIEINDFKSMVVYGKTKKIMKSRRQDKGHYNELIKLIEGIKKMKNPIPLEEIEVAHILAFAVSEGVRR